MKKLILLSLIAVCSMATLFFCGSAMSIEINIGTNNQVSTGTISGIEGCLEGSGKMQTEKRSVGSFEKLSVDGVFTVRVLPGKDGPVLVTADDNLLELVTTVVKDGELFVTTTKSYCTQNEMTLEVPVRDLAGLKVDGSSTIEVAAEASIAGKLTIEVNGTSSLTIEGSGSELQVGVHDTGEIDASQFLADHVMVTASDAAVAKVHPRSRLEGSCTDASEIHLYGKPDVVNVQVADAAELIMDN